jgi:RHS repeat-associated protein
MNKVTYTAALLMGFFYSVLVYGQGSPADLPASVSSNPLTVAPTASKNYICSYTYRAAVTTRPYSFTAGSVSVDVGYFDGLGRPVQTVSVMGSPLGKDVVSWQPYDLYGRVTIQYLPYTKTSVGNNGAYTETTVAISEQSAFLSNLYGATDGLKGYSVTLFESSPLNRVSKQGAPGVSWQPEANPVTKSYETNTSEVASWFYSGDTYSAYSYPVNSLYVNKTTDEDVNPAREYKDKEGRLIMKEVYTGTTWLKTNYCYDGYGLLRCVVPPAGTMGDDSYCYYYKYDTYNRLIAKHLPGCSWKYMVYDTRDRLVLSQDGALSPVDWNYTIYDNLNRPIESGTYYATVSQDNLATSLVSNINYMAAQQSRIPMTYLYYDDYTGLSSDYAKNAAGTVATRNYGRQTWAKTKLLETESGMNTWLITAVYYDDYGRVLQTVSDNHLGGKDYVTNSYNFSGQVINVNIKNIADGITNNVTKYFYYDHRGRLLKTDYYFQSFNPITLVAYVYNEAGKQTIKYQNSYQSSAFLQKMDYKYNIRGWLTQINDPNSFGENDKFGLKLYYETPPTGGTACYNGNISGMGWGSTLKPNLLSRYTYDRLNRLTASNYVGTAYPAGAFGTSYTYNYNGFIYRITRKNSTANVIDDLYIGNSGNKISNITWDYGGDYGGSGYVDYPGLSSTNSLQFVYDNNGNMTYEPYKLMSLTYNRLNLPEVINFGSNKKISYFYTAAGQKVRQVVEIPGTLTKVDYCGPFVYETNNGVRSLKYLITEEGRVVYNGTSWIWEYDQTDHLGNVRTVVRKNATTGLAELIQDNHYFPFGMLMSDISSSPSSNNRFRYNGKEYQNDLGLEWYDYGARFYDPELGRWHSPDPLAEVNRRWSPYRYAYDNPMKFIDPDGMLEDLYLKGEDAQQAFRQLQASTNLKLSKAEDGKVSASGSAETDGDKQLLAAINDENVIVNVSCDNDNLNYSRNGKLYTAKTGGAFMGNSIDSKSKKVLADQVVVPDMFDFYTNNLKKGNTGDFMKHEVIEAFLGGIIASLTGIPLTPNVTADSPQHKFSTHQPPVSDTDAIQARKNQRDINYFRKQYKFVPGSD